MYDKNYIESTYDNIPTTFREIVQQTDPPSNAVRKSMTQQEQYKLMQKQNLLSETNLSPMSYRLQLQLPVLSSHRLVETDDNDTQMQQHFQPQQQQQIPQPSPTDAKKNSIVPSNRSRTGSINNFLQNYAEQNNLQQRRRISGANAAPARSLFNGGRRSVIEVNNTSLIDQVQRRRDLEAKALKKIKFILDHMPFRQAQRCLEQFHEKQFNLVGDLASYFQIFSSDKRNASQGINSLLSQESKRNKLVPVHLVETYRIFKKIYYKLHNLTCARIPVLEPGNIICILIYFITILVSIVLLILVSFKVGFITKTEDAPELMDILKVMRQLAGVVYVFELLIHLNTAYYSMGKLESSRAKIFEHVKRKTLLWDLVSLVALYYTVYASNSFGISETVIELTIFLKIFSLQLIQKNLEGRFMRILDSPIYSVMILMGKIAVLNHVISILWYLLNYFETQYQVSDTTWLGEQELIDAPWWVRYLVCYYWGLSLLTTGGATSPSATVYENAFAIVVILMTVCFMGYVISKVMNIMEKLNEKNIKKRRELSIMNTYMTQKGVRADVQAKVQNYLQYLHRGHSDMASVTEFKEVFDQLPPQLQDEIKEDVNLKALQKFSFLNQLFTVKTLTQLLPYVTQEFYMPNQLIYEQGDSKEFSLYALVKGEVNLLQHSPTLGEGKRQTQTNTVAAGQVFGLEAFFAGDYSNESAHSLSFTTVYRITRSDFLDATHADHHDFERFCQIRDELLFGSRFSQTLSSVCNYCDSRNHAKDQCNIVHYVPNRRQYVYRENSFFQVRKPHNRRIPTQHSRSHDSSVNDQVYSKKFVLIQDDSRQIFDIIYGSEAQEDLNDIFFDSDLIERHVEFLIRTEIQEAMWKFIRFNAEEIEDMEEEREAAAAAAASQEDIVSINCDQSICEEEEEEEKDSSQCTAKSSDKDEKEKYRPFKMKKQNLIYSQNNYKIQQNPDFIPEENVQNEQSERVDKNFKNEVQKHLTVSFQASSEVDVVTEDSQKKQNVENNAPTSFPRKSISQSDNQQNANVSQAQENNMQQQQEGSAQAATDVPAKPAHTPFFSNLLKAIEKIKQKGPSLVSQDTVNNPPKPILQVKSVHTLEELEAIGDVEARDGSNDLDALNVFQDHHEQEQEKQGVVITQPKLKIMLVTQNSAANSQDNQYSPRASSSAFAPNSSAFAPSLTSLQVMDLVVEHQDSAEKSSQTQPSKNLKDQKETSESVQSKNNTNLAVANAQEEKSGVKKKSRFLTRELSLKNVQKSLLTPRNGTENIMKQAVRKIMKKNPNAGALTPRPSVKPVLHYRNKLAANLALLMSPNSRLNSATSNLFIQPIRDNLNMDNQAGQTQQSPLKPGTGGGGFLSMLQKMTLQVQQSNSQGSQLGQRKAEGIISEQPQEEQEKNQLMSKKQNKNSLNNQLDKATLNQLNQGKNQTKNRGISKLGSGTRTSKHKSEIDQEIAAALPSTGTETAMVYRVASRQSASKQEETSSTATKTANIQQILLALKELGIGNMVALETVLQTSQGAEKIAQLIDAQKNSTERRSVDTASSQKQINANNQQATRGSSGSAVQNNSSYILQQQVNQVQTQLGSANIKRQSVQDVLKQLNKNGLYDDEDDAKDELAVEKLFYEFDKQHNFSAYFIQQNLDSVVAMYKIVRGAKELAKHLKGKKFSYQDLFNGKGKKHHVSSRIAKKLKKAQVQPTDSI